MAEGWPVVAVVPSDFGGTQEAPGTEVAVAGPLAAVAAGGRWSPEVGTSTVSMRPESRSSQTRRRATTYSEPMASRTSRTRDPVVEMVVRRCHWSARIWTSAPGALGERWMRPSSETRPVRSCHSATWGSTSARTSETRRRAVGAGASAPGKKENQPSVTRARSKTASVKVAASPARKPVSSPPSNQR